MFGIMRCTDYHPNYKQKCWYLYEIFETEKDAIEYLRVNNLISESNIFTGNIVEQEFSRN